MSMGQVSPFTQPQDAIVTKVSVGIPGIKMAGDDWNPGWGGDMMYYSTPVSNPKTQI